jgi:putative transposase
MLSTRFMLIGFSVTKYRRSALSQLAIHGCDEVVAKVCFDSELLACAGEDDHVHLLIADPLKGALSKRVNSLKRVSSRLLHQWRPEVRERYDVLWSPPSFARSRGETPLFVIAEYIRNQRQRDALPPRPQGHGSRAKN